MEYENPICQLKILSISVYVGCYEDKGDRMLKGPSKNFQNSNSKETCEDFCQDFKWYAMQSTVECFCGDTLAHMQEKPQTDCDKECPGNESQICGGHWRNSLYRYRNLENWQNMGTIGKLKYLRITIKLWL